MVQASVGVEATPRTDIPVGAARLPLSICAMTRGGSGRLAAVLQLLRPLAAEVVVALDARSEGEAELLATVADEVVVFPHRDPGDSLIPWLHAQCGSDWILNIDDDEVPGGRLLAHLPELLAASVTHWWLPRRWLVGDGTTYLDEPPWVPDYQLRLYRNDPALLRFSDEFHRPVIVSGPAGFGRDPLWHLDCVLNSFERRREKALAYERARRGMRVAGLAHNAGLYLPELQPGVKTTPVSEVSRRLIRNVLAEPEAAKRPARGVVRCAGREEIEALWPGEPFEPSLSTGRLRWVQPIERLIAGAEHTVSVTVENRSKSTWRYGCEAAPLIQVGSRWLDDRGTVEGIHTPLPADLAPGDTVVVPVHVRAPLQPGRYRLVIDLVHEHVRWFDFPIDWTVEVVPRRRVAVVGRDEALEEALDQLHLQPELEPIILERADELAPERYGHERSAGFAAYLLAGLEGPITPRVLATLTVRTTRLLRHAHRLRVGKATAPLPNGADDCLRHLASCERLQIAGVDWEPHAAPTRELWRLATTAAAARRLGLEVVVDPGALTPAGTIDRLLARVIVGFKRSCKLAPGGVKMPPALENVEGGDRGGDYA